MRSRLREVVADPEALSEAEVPAPPSYDPGLDPEGRLGDYYRHFVHCWTRDLERRVSEVSGLSEDNTVLKDFLDAQCQAVGVLLVRTLLGELFLRKSQGLLRGASPEERYRSFRAWTNSAEGHRDLLSRYPHMFRTARDRVRAAANGLTHTLARVERHRERLDTLPGVTPGCAIATVLAGQGDMHNGGRSVAQVVFADGGRVLYKPRPLDSDVGFNALVGWFNDRLGTSLSTVKVIPCRDEGFVEFVRTDVPGSREKDYFAQIGQLLAILHLIKAIDIHFENVVTGADGPVVVDTETLLTPRLRLRNPEEDRSARGRANTILRESVLGIGVLPVLVNKPGHEGMDVGVIGYDPGQEIPYKSLQIRNPGRDDMFVELARGRAANSTANLSVSRATEVPVREQRDTIKHEMRRVLEYAAAHKNEVAGAVEEFLGDAPFRFLNNSTMFYSQLLRMAKHPDAMADPLVRAAVFGRVFLNSRGMLQIADEETRQLEGGDVPYFRYSPRSRALLSAEGRVVLDDAFEVSGMDAVREQISDLGPETIDRQVTMVDFSFVGKLPLRDDLTGFVPRRPLGRAPVRVGRGRLLDEAVRVGDTLVDSMIDGPDGRRSAVWIAPQVVVQGGSEWSPGVSGDDLYSGIPGIALALAGLARETGEERYRKAALRVVEPLEESLSRVLEGSAGIAVSGMSGPDGAVYALATARRVLGGGGLGTGALARVLMSDTGTPASGDFVTGAAGTLAICLSLYRNATGDEDRALAMEAARVFADFQVRDAAERGAADGRVTEYTGYAHGAIGIAPALLEYSSLTGDRAARELGTRMAEAVRDVQTDDTREWPRGWDDDACTYAWCHGAPGILLGALEVTRHAPGLFPDAALARLAELTMTHGFGNNPTYCHGDLGSLEAVMLAERVRPGLFGEGVDDLYPRLFTDVVERYSAKTDTRYAHSNGLMVGQSGMLWSILRYLDPGSYPSVVRFA